MKRLRRCFCLIGLALLLCGPVLAHIGDNFDSVHFNSGSPDFGELPRRAVMPHEIEVRTGFGGYGMDYHRNPAKEELNPEATLAHNQRLAKRESALCKEATKAEAYGDWRGARAVYIRLAGLNGWTGDLRDRVTALSDVLESARPVPATTVRLYMQALDLLDKRRSDHWSEAQNIFRRISLGSDNGVLRPHALYQIASVYAAWFDYPRAVEGYQRLLQQYPRSTETESALIMLARAAILPHTAPGRNLPAGRKALTALARDYPKTRFRRSALGLQARLDFIDGRYSQAIEAYFSLGDLESVEAVLKRTPKSRWPGTYARLLTGYLRRLDHADEYNGYVRSVEDIRRVIINVTDADARQFLQQLRHDPAVAAPYFYYRLYHCDNSTSDLRGLARLAHDIASSAASLAPNIEVRFAEVFYSSKDYTEALDWSKRASQHSPGRCLDRAAFVTGASLYKLRRFGEARSAFTTLLLNMPRSPLAFAAREEDALCCESIGDLDGALDQYFQLGYKDDIAYLVDVRMPIADLESYAAKRRNSVHWNMLTYSLGIRYLRQENWIAARAKFDAVPPKVFRRFWNPAFDSEARGYGFDEDPQNPWKTLGDLARLQRASARPGISENARASALYHYASYYYQHGTLLLYCLAAWHGDRADDFAFYWNNAVATPADIAAVRTHMYEHEVYARTEVGCRQIARDYPESPTAPYALYRGACAARKLANFNGWWRSELRHHDHYQEASNMMHLLAHRYPRHPLAAEARKFARVFGEDALAMAAVRREDAAEERKHPEESRYNKVGWFP